MEIVPQLISRFSLVIYAVLGIAAAYFLIVGYSASREWQRSNFRLERLSARSRMMSAIFRILLCGLLAVGVYLITGFTSAPIELVGRASTSVTGTLTQPTSLPTARFTPTVIFVTPASGVLPTGRPQIITQTNQSGGVIVTIITTTLEATSTTANARPPTTLPTLVPTLISQPTTRPSPLPAPPSPSQPSPSLIAQNCANPRAQIFTITNEAGPRIYTIRGNAQIEAGWYYKIEMRLPGSGDWAFLSRGEDRVTAGVLLNGFNFSSLPAGNYPVRLLLIGDDGNNAGICETILTLN
jgi:hypothetical protein